MSPRAVLRSVSERARSMGVEPNVGVELEFYVLRETPRRSAPSARHSSWRSTSGRVSTASWRPRVRSGSPSGARDAAQLRAGDRGVQPRGRSRTVRDQPARGGRPTAADEAFLLKSAVKEIAARPGAAGDVHGQAALGLAGQLVPPAPQLRRRRPGAVADHAPLHRRTAVRAWRSSARCSRRRRTPTGVSSPTRGRRRPRRGASTTAPRACARSAAATARRVWSTARRARTPTRTWWSRRRWPPGSTA